MIDMRTGSLSTSPTTTFDREALADFYERYSPDIFRYARRLLDDSALAEDCVADTFHRFLIAVRNGTSIENQRAYLYRTAHNWITDHYRRRQPPHVSLEDEVYSAPEENPSHVVAREMDRQRMRAALLQLSPEQRQVIELRYMEDLSHLEVAVVLGKSVEATRALQYRALEALRQIFAD
jgi:RNA polymerase sigma-70 factor (ECF subfamily)